MRKSAKLVPLHARTNIASASQPPAKKPSQPSTFTPSSASTATAAPVNATARATLRSWECIASEPRKHKNGSFDGKVVLALDKGRATLYDDAEQQIAVRTIHPKDMSSFASGETVLFSKWQVELGTEIGGAGLGASTVGNSGAAPVAAATAAPRPLPPARPPPPAPPAAARPLPPARPPPPAPPPKAKPITGLSHARKASTAAAPPPPRPKAAAPARSSASSSSCSSATATAAASSDAEQLVLNRDDVPAARPVIVDRQLARAMRPWQVEGLQFMYGCVSGATLGASGRPLSGCILAHAPGLGKTLQALSLVFTLLRTGPAGSPLIRKAIVVCPASLCKNWAAEVKRWLPQRLRCQMLPPTPQAASQAVLEFCRCPPQQLLICSYEAIRAHADALAAAPIGLLICDEGHRLKSSQGNQTVDGLRKLGRARRILLTGTPMQNELKEFWALADFACPGELGDLATFNARIAAPVDRGREAGASASEREAAEAAAERFRTLSEPFIQRRDGTVLQAHLPPRTELALFPSLSKREARAYRRAIDEEIAEFDKSRTIALITRLQQICSNGEAAGAAGAEEEEDDEDEQQQPDEEEGAGSALSAALPSKLRLLMRLLAPIRAAGEQVVLCSNFHRTLDLLEGVLTDNGWGALRIDGTTPARERQERVDRFNAKKAFAFLLASKAGGTGFNLVGANRLVLIDPDWNPAVDQQAMGRVYRQGQLRPVFVWRLFSAGTIEERIFMRQLYKKQLNGLVDDDKGGAGGGDGGGGGDEGSGGSGAEDLTKQTFDKRELRDHLLEFESGDGATTSGKGGGRSSCVTLSTLLSADVARQQAMAAAWLDELPDARLQEALGADARRLADGLAFACDVRVLEELSDERAAAAREAQVEEEEEWKGDEMEEEEAEEGEDDSEEEEEEGEEEEQEEADERRGGRKRKNVVLDTSSDEDED